MMSDDVRNQLETAIESAQSQLAQSSVHEEDWKARRALKRAGERLTRCVKLLTDHLADAGNEPSQTTTFQAKFLRILRAVADEYGYDVLVYKSGRRSTVRIQKKDSLDEPLIRFHYEFEHDRCRFTAISGVDVGKDVDHAEGRWRTIGYDDAEGWRDLINCIEHVLNVPEDAVDGRAPAGSGS